MDKEPKIETWIVKDTDGEQIYVHADDWKGGSDGLWFHLNGGVVAVFSRWANFRLAEPAQNHGSLPQIDERCPKCGEMLKEFDFEKNGAFIRCPNCD